MHPKVYALAAVTLSQYAGFNVKEVEYFVGGLFMGLIQKDDLTEIETCLTDATTLSTLITKAFASFMEKSVEGAIQGIEEIGEALVQIPGDLQHCEGMQQDISRVEAWAGQFKNPTAIVPKIAKNVMLHY